MTVKTDSEKSRRQSVHQYALRHSGVNCSVVITDPPYAYSSYDAFSRTRSGGPVPNYRARISMALDATGAYSVDATRTQYGHGEVYTEWTTTCGGKKNRDSDNVTGCMDLPTFGTFVDFTSKVNQARNDAFGRFWSQASSMESRGSTFLGELRETVGMLRNPFQGTRKLLDGYFSTLRKNSKYIRRLTPQAKRRYLASQYLELQFGWIPLIQDTKDILDSAIRISNEVELASLRSYSEISSSSSTGTTLSPVVNYTQLYRSSRTRQHARVTCRGAYKLTRYSESPIQAVRDNLGLLPSGFIPTVWELIPYSFAIDYFANIGDIISAACTCRGNIAWSCTSQVIEESQETNYSICTPAALSSVSLAGYAVGYHSPAQRTRYRFTRSAGVPTPSFQVSLPGFKQSLNLSALLAQWRSTSNSL